MSEDTNECAICGHYMPQHQITVIYDGDKCHQKCALEDQDSIGFDSDFGASG